MTRLRRLALAAALLASVATAPRAAAQEAGGATPGTVTTGTVTSNGTEYPYLLSTPTSYRPDRPSPLVVVVHGCQTTAGQERELTRYDELAEREGVVVLYPEVDGLGQQLPGPLNHCWRFFDPTAYLRGSSDVAAIAAMTDRVMAERTIDPERVYVVGVSAGGLMAGAAAAAYPERYAAVGIVTSAGYLDALCFTTGIGIPVEVSAQLAHAQMGPRARVVPAIVIGSDADLAFPATCTHKAMAQSLRTNNLVLSGTQDGPLALAPATVREEEVPDGLAYTVSTFVDPDGCLVGEEWLIHGMPHAWPGGADYGGYTDTRAPDGAEATWSFLSRFRRSDTSPPCTEATAAAPPPTTTTVPAADGPAPPTTAEPVAGGDRLPATGGGGAATGALLVAGAALAIRALSRRPDPR